MGGAMMQIEGGVCLDGAVTISGGKNAALPVLAATLLAEGDSVVENLPHLSDIATMVSVLQHMGVHCQRVSGTGGGSLRVNADSVKDLEAPYDLVRRMRASVLVLGPALARFGYARVALPGGCNIGARPIDQHLKGLAALGASYQVTDGFVEVKAPKEGLRGVDYTFDMITVGGTENLMMAATLSKGITRLRRAAREPEIVNLAHSLRAMGAIISGEGTDEITIEGREQLIGAPLRIIPDRIEAGSYLLCAAMTGGRVRAEGASAEDMQAFLALLRDAGAEVLEHPDYVEVAMHGKLPKAVSVVTGEHPHFPTDLQAPICAMNAIASGEARVEERIFENRFMHCSELVRMGAKIDIFPHYCRFHGGTRLRGARVQSTDLRASFALILAGLAAQGMTYVEQLQHLERGYAHVEENLNNLGANVIRMVS